MKRKTLPLLLVLLLLASHAPLAFSQTTPSLSDWASVKQIKTDERVFVRQKNGKEIKGEGLVGLTRGFMYAGAPRVVASLWQIDDRASAEFMKRFYQGMLVQKLRPAAALRAAQISMQKDKRWNNPHYWAAFTLQGEWR